MAFIISTDTNVSSPFNNALSVNTSTNNQRQILYQLSNKNPIYDAIINLQISVSISIYSPGPSKSTANSVNCEPADSVLLQVDPGFCGSAVTGASINGNFYVSNYTYTKTRDTYGVENWSFVSAPQYLDDNLNVIYEALFLRGVALGSSTEPENNTGVNFSSNTVESTSMGVSAGFPGVGQANVTKNGIVSSVGGGKGPGDTDGQASVAIPYTPIINDVSTFSNRIKT